MKINEIVDTLLVAADFVLLAIDGNELIKTATPAVRTIFHKQEGEVEGATLSELIPGLTDIQIPGFDPIEPRGGLGSLGDDGVATCDSQLLEYLASYKQHAGKYEVPINVDGESRWIDLAVYKLEVESELMFVVTINDITRRKEIDAQIRELNENLEQKVEERTAELQGRNEQIKKIVTSCASELTQVNDNYQMMKERQMDMAEGMETAVIGNVSGLTEDQVSQVREIFNQQMVKAMELYSEDQITDQKFMLTIISLNELFGKTDEQTENMRPDQLSGTNQDEVDDLLDSLGI